MARNLGVFVRNLLPNSKCIQNHTLKTLTLASSYPSTPSSQAKPFSNSLPSPNVNFLQQQQHRRLSSPFSGSRHSRFTNLKSGLQFRRMMFSLRSTVMYSSVVRELIEQYPNVLGYKIDASKEDFDCAMTTFSVRAVGIFLQPAVVFVKDKKWVSYVVGVNVALLKCTLKLSTANVPPKKKKRKKKSVQRWMFMPSDSAVPSASS
ncbi:hypothetical protein C1H46_032790 [Malus baccata]|uniref:Uncharacterized protein n=1 Tax=Malus baccata TaxID=106549 RepID=A0A540L570_MALBA|nr:hypothetical protein C1H46_032790 [Malus baccata]